MQMDGYPIVILADFVQVGTPLTEPGSHIQKCCHVITSHLHVVTNPLWRQRAR